MQPDRVAGREECGKQGHFRCGIQEREAQECFPWWWWCSSISHPTDQESPSPSQALQAGAFVSREQIPWQQRDPREGSSGFSCLVHGRHPWDKSSQTVHHTLSLQWGLYLHVPGTDPCHAWQGGHPRMDASGRWFGSRQQKPPRG